MVKDSNLTVVIPCYNEEESLQDLMPELLHYVSGKKWKVILINDGSTDRSKDILESFQGCPNYKFYNHNMNKGYGGALKTAIRKVDTEFFVSMDADGQHYLEDIDLLYNVQHETEADLIIGSRRNIKSSDFYRNSGKWIIRKISKLLVNTNVYDINSGMKLCRTRLAKKNLNLCPDTMAFSEILTLIFSARKYYVIEVPIRIKERSGGKSTIGFKTAFDTTMQVLNIVMLFNPIKIFVPVSVIFFLLGIGWGFPIILAGRGVSVGAALLIIMGVMTFLLGLIAEQLALLRKGI